jgi:methylated-DNA-[protein]-cysteine S-methyltransferase
MAGVQPTGGDAAAAIHVAVRSLRTPIGVLNIAASDDSVLYIELPGVRAERPLERWLRGRSDTPALRQALTELREYFAGKRRHFEVRVDPAGTEFQQRVWRAIAAIPYGETTSYGRIAEDLGGLRLARAVGAATGANPIPVIIPCHRVLGVDGSLTGYGGGLRRKVWLLQHEGVLLA